jgi:uncharacterized protein (DUF2126 family)
MSIHVALNHQSIYAYDRPVTHHPHLIRLRPAPHCRTTVISYSLQLSSKDHFLNWQQDPFGNYLARSVFQKPLKDLRIEVDLVAEIAVHNPFDFFLESYAEQFPFKYETWLHKELRPYLETPDRTPCFLKFVRSIDQKKVHTVDFLVRLNQRLNKEIKYLIRLEPGVQTPEETLTKQSGSCRDSAWLMVQLLRWLGLAARFASGYLIQLKADLKSLDGPSGTEVDFTDLHAWCEVYLPGAGWIGLDPTSGLLAGEGHIPLACTPDPTGAAPITGSTDLCKVKFKHSMQVSRIYESPRVTLPYEETVWKQIRSLGDRVDARLRQGDIRLTMGGEPTFVSIDDMGGDEWNYTALSDKKLTIAKELSWRLKSKLAKGGLLHHGQGKWYPGESLPRWALSCYWRKNGLPLWENPALLAWKETSGNATKDDAKRFAHTLTELLNLDDKHILPAYEDIWYYLWRERRLPSNVDPLQSKLSEPEERKRLAKVFEQGLDNIVGYTLPLRLHPLTGAWETGPWFLRREYLFLTPGDSPMGYRLPLDSLPWQDPSSVQSLHAPDPMTLGKETGATSGFESGKHKYDGYHTTLSANDRGIGVSQGIQSYASSGHPHEAELKWQHPSVSTDEDPSSNQSIPQQIVRTALCIEPRNGILHIFMPPMPTATDYFRLIQAVETTARKCDTPVIIEGETPPFDPAYQSMKVTPDPGVIEVNVPPSDNWEELCHMTETVYEEARQSRLGTEKFLMDGRHTGTGGGNHMTLGGTTPSDSPFLRRPDLLKSLVTYWQNHPSLSFLFSGMFIGPTSQHPRVDEARNDSLYELEIANRQVSKKQPIAPWLVDRIYRNLLVDLTGNTHRAEFCIDKMFSPDSASGRLGLLEMRAFEMPPHHRMSLVQQLLLRSIICRVWEDPYEQPMVRWGTQIHDRFMLPYFNQLDFQDVIQDLQDHQLPIDFEWFAPHLEFRFPKHGEFTRRAIHLELRHALEPWNALGEQGSLSGTSRFVDSSLERLQIKASGLIDSRYWVTCNGRRIPLHPTGVLGEFVAGVRYRAWQPGECLHPTIGVHAPLVFDIHDSWNNRSIGGCQYHVGDPAGRNHEQLPINAFEAESRRLARFFNIGHTGGACSPPPMEQNRDFPMTLDLRMYPQQKEL